MPDINRLAQDLQQIENLEVKRDTPLQKYTSFKIGGPADIFLIPLNIDALCAGIAIVNQYDVDSFILGRGSNIVVADRGYRGVVIYTGKLNKTKIKKQQITAEAGITLSALANTALDSGLSGLEFASGIPGSLGGALFMNAGAYGKEMKDVIHKATLVDYEGQQREYTHQELNLSYRHSILQDEKLIAATVTMKLEKGNHDDIESLMKKLNQKRKDKQPLEWPSAGSSFKRPPGNYAGPLIEKAGMKGERVGDAQVSKKHAGFIINRGQATAEDIIQLIKKVQAEVYKTSGVQLEPEPIFIGEFE